MRGEILRCGMTIALCSPKDSIQMQSPECRPPKTWCRCQHSERFFAALGMAEARDPRKVLSQGGAQYIILSTLLASGVGHVGGAH